MVQLGPWEGHRRGWFAVAAFSLFGFFGGSVGMAAIPHHVASVPEVMVPTVDPSPSVVPVYRTVLSPASPSVVVTTRVVKVYVVVTPSATSSPDKKPQEPKPATHDAPSSQRYPTTSPTALPTPSDPTHATASSSVPTATGTPSGTASS